jgi:NAD-dependent deacetylase
MGTPAAGTMNTGATLSETLQSALKRAGEVVVFSGAGMSAESGVPTFRGEDGLWKKFRPEELANFGAFMRNPALVWEWYDHRRKIISSVEPNAGHRAIVAMEHICRKVTVITQNIDNLHQRAGSSIVHELHGNINRNYCVGCGMSVTDIPATPEGTAPRCAACGGLIRPDVVWFGEDLPVDEWNASVAVAQRADLLFAVGTSGVVYPAASIPVLAKRAGALVVEINTERTEISALADETILGKAGEILPRIVESMNFQHK